MVCEAKNCKEFIMNNRQKFGITENNLTSECLDICTKNVKYIASRRINERIVLPSMSQFINSCTGLVDTACGIDTKFASLRITHATEQLVDCDSATPGVQVTIKGQVIVRTKPVSCSCPASYMAIPVELVSEVIYDFYSTQNGERAACLANVLPAIDGSCMVINLSCRIYREVCQGSSRYIAHIRGSVVDKLWKTENIWVEGIRPYPSNSVSVCEKFEKDFCPAASDDYVSLGNDGYYTAETAGNDCGCDCGCGDCANNGCTAGYTNGYNNGGCDNGCDNGCTAGSTNEYNNGGCGNGCDNDCDNGCTAGYTNGYNNGGCGNGCTAGYSSGCGCYTNRGGCDCD